VPRLSVCCDGTWQDVAQDTNEVWLRAAIVPGPGDAGPHHLPGVGSLRTCSTGCGAG
jgi:hypothetical protein